MHKAAAADVNAGMVGDGGLAKQHQIPGLQNLLRNAAAPERQLSRGARRLDTGAALVHVANQAAAVKTGLWRVAAVAVRRAHQAQRIQGYVVGLLGIEAAGHRIKNFRGGRGLGRQRDAAATCERSRQKQRFQNEAKPPASIVGFFKKNGSSSISL